MNDDAKNNAGGNEGGDGGTGAFPKWMSSLPDAFKTNETLAEYKDAPPWEKFVNLLGAEKSMIQIPGEKATDEERAAFFAKIGRPENPDGYNITRPADLPEGIPYDPAFEKAFKEFAHANNFTKDQAEKAYSWYYGLVKNGAEVQAKEFEKAQTDGINALKDQWKDKYDGNVKIAQIAFKKFGKDAETLLDEAKIGNVRLGDHPAFLKVFYEIGIKTLDDSALKGEGGGKELAGDEEAQMAAKFFPSMQKK